MDERQFFDESRTTRDAVLICPRCRERNTYKLRWLVRRKKRRLAGRADDRDRAKFAKAQSYMLLLDDMVSCSNQRCRGRIEVAGIKTTAFLEDPPGEGNRQERQGKRNRPDVDGNRA